MFSAQSVGTDSSEGCSFSLGFATTGTAVLTSLCDFSFGGTELTTLFALDFSFPS